MAFRTNSAPYQRSKNSTLKIMLILLAGLVVVWIASIIYNFALTKELGQYVKEYVDANPESGLQAPNYGLRAILLPLIAILACDVSDVVTSLLRHKKGENLGKEILDNLIYNYSWISGLIFALTLPVYTPIYVVIVGSVFATVVVKNFFGGFGKNIFNPAALARIFVMLAFGSQLALPEVFKTVSTAAGIDLSTGATVSAAYKSISGWLATSYESGTELIRGTIVPGFTLKQLLVGNYVGAMGETFTLLILGVGVILSILKVINWRTPVFYMGTVSLTALVIALVLGFDNPFNYVLYHLSLGGLAFGAVFMLTDPVTGPTSNYGKTLMAVLAGLLTVLIRVKGGYPEGVVFSIAVCNILSCAVDYFVVGKSNAHLVRKSCIVGGLVLVSIGLCTGVSWKQNGGREVYEINGFSKAEYNVIASKLELGDRQLAKADDYTIVNEDTIKNAYYIVDKNGNKLGMLYEVSLAGVAYTEPGVSGYQLKFTSLSYVGISYDKTVTDFTILNPANSKNFGMENTITGTASEYIGQSNISYKDASVGLISGATYSTEHLKLIIEAALAEFDANN